MASKQTTTQIRSEVAEKSGFTIERRNELQQASSGAFYMRASFYLVPINTASRENGTIMFRDLASVNAYLEMIQPELPLAEAVKPPTLERLEDADVAKQVARKRG